MNGMVMRSEVWLGSLLALLLCCAVACDPSSGDPREIVVVHLGEERLTLAELESYLQANLLQLTADDDQKRVEQYRVQSRLLDAFVEERLLLAEAAQRGLQVEDWEVDAYLALDEPDEGRAQAGIEARRQLARQRLMVQMLREGTILGLPPLEVDEVRRYAAKHGERLLSERRLQLRALLLGTEEEAQKVYNDLRRRKLTFDEAVAAYETYPGQGRSLSIPWNSLSADARGALEEFKPGQVSPPLEMQGSHYVFKVESWLSDPAQVALERQTRARLELQDVRRQQALEELFMELRERHPVRIVRRNLPFRYLQEEAD
jgi:parvulin-like peptidyl-prolyl isomerase